MKNIISTDKAPAAIGPYSQAVEVNGLVFTSGVVPIDPATGELVTGPAEVQAERAFKSLKALLEAAGSSTANVIKTTVFISDMNTVEKTAYQVLCICNFAISYCIRNIHSEIRKGRGGRQ